MEAKSLPDAIKEVSVTFSQLFENEETLKDQIFDVKISIEPCSGKSGGLGIDTTRLYKELDPAKQYGHSTKMMPMQANKYSRYYSDPNRAQRQHDVVVTAVSTITEKRWRADIGKDNVIVLSLNKKPFKVVLKQKDQLINDLNTLLKMVSTAPTFDIQK